MEYSNKLSIQDIIEASGYDTKEKLSSLQELEILFTSFDEISNLHLCPSLTSLSRKLIIFI